MRTHRRDGLADSATPARISVNVLGLGYCIVAVMASWIHACATRAHLTFIPIIPKRTHRNRAAHRQTNGRCDQRGCLRCSPTDQLHDMAPGPPPSAVSDTFPSLARHVYGVQYCPCMTCIPCPLAINLALPSTFICDLALYIFAMHWFACYDLKLLNTYKCL